MFNLGLTRFVPAALRGPLSDALWAVADRPRFRPELCRGDDAILQCRTAYNIYGAYCVPLSSSYRPAACKILAGKVWEPDTLAYMSAHARGGDIVHAGTFFGDFIPALSKAVGPQNRVWAFEPNPENVRCAGITISLNRAENVILTHAALGAVAGTLPMQVRDATGRSLGGASHLVQHIGDDAVTMVPVVTVDSVVPADRTVKILQLDVEGFEQQALTGALETIRRCRPILILETLPAQTWLAENILSLGYAHAGRLYDNWVLEPAATWSP